MATHTAATRAAQQPQLAVIFGMVVLVNGALLFVFGDEARRTFEGMAR